MQCIIVHYYTRMSRIVFKKFDSIGSYLLTVSKQLEQIMALNFCLQFRLSIHPDVQMLSFSQFKFFISRIVFFFLSFYKKVRFLFRTGNVSMFLLVICLSFLHFVSLNVCFEFVTHFQSIRQVTTSFNTISDQSVIYW